MELDWLNIILFFFGIYLTIFGARILFQKGFLEKLMKGDWKSKDDRWTEREHYIYGKYGRGISYFGSGLILLAYTIWMLFF